MERVERTVRLTDNPLLFSGLFLGFTGNFRQIFFFKCML